MFFRLYRIFELTFPNVYVQMLFVFTISGILTWAFLKKLLNPFINAVLAILACTFDVLLTFFFGPIGWAGNKIDKHISGPIRKATIKIHVPTLVKALIYAVLGVAVFALDHVYGVRIFQSDESFAMYPIEINGVKFWVSEVALWIGGFFIGLSILYTVNEILRGLNRLLDRTVQISFLFYR